MQKIREELQEMEDEQMDGYQLKTNEEIIDIISEFGNGETEFHTLDINRIVVENERVINFISALKKDLEIYDHGATYIRAANNIITQIEDIFQCCR